MSKKKEREAIETAKRIQQIRQVKDSVVASYGIKNLRLYIPTSDDTANIPTSPPHTQDPHITTITPTRYSRRITNARRIKCSCGTLFTTPFGKSPQAFDSYITHYKYHLEQLGTITPHTLQSTNTTHHIIQFDERIMYDDNDAIYENKRLSMKTLNRIVEELRRRGLYNK